MRKHFISVFLILAMLFACAASADELMTRQTDTCFSTVTVLSLQAAPEQREAFEAVWAQTKALMEQVEQAVSVSVPDSDIARFNALASGEACEISPITARIMQIAFRMYLQTDGLYDPTVFPLVDLWGFSPRFNENTYAPVMPYDRAYENGRLPLPDRADIDALLPLVGLSGIELYEEDGRWMLRKNTPSVWMDGVCVNAALDLGGLAKGYACDLVMALLREAGFTKGTFACGGSSMAILESAAEDGCYALTLRKPRKGASSGSHYAAVRVKNTTLSSSADYNHCYVVDGVVYCHIIDPRTGCPINMPDADGVQRGIASLTLLGGSAAENDAMTTALCVMGAREALSRLAHMEDSAVMAVCSTASEAYEVLTSMDEETLTIDDEAYRLASRRTDTGLVYTGTILE